MPAWKDGFTTSRGSQEALLPHSCTPYAVCSSRILYLTKVSHRHASTCMRALEIPWIRSIKQVSTFAVVRILSPHIHPSRPLTGRTAQVSFTSKPKFEVQCSHPECQCKVSHPIAFTSFKARERLKLAVPTLARVDC